MLIGYASQASDGWNCWSRASVDALRANRKRGVALGRSIEQSISFKKASRRLTTIDSGPYEAVENSLGPTLAGWRKLVDCANVGLTAGIGCAIQIPACVLSESTHRLGAVATGKGEDCGCGPASALRGRKLEDRSIAGAACKVCSIKVASFIRDQTRPKASDVGDRSFRPGRSLRLWGREFKRCPQQNVARSCRAEIG